MTEPETFTSVTALTGLLPKTLHWWAANATADCAFYKQDEWRHLETREERYEYVRRAHQRIKDTAADLGSEVHRYVEAHNLGQPTPVWPLPVRAKMTAFAHFVDDWGLEVEAAETKVYSRAHGYAGTLDILGRVTARDDRLAVIDIKTGKSIWPEAGLQVAAYGRADFLVADPHHPGAVQVTPQRGRRYYTWQGPPEDEIPMPDVQAGYVLHLRDDGYTVHEVPDLDDAWGAFLSLRPIDDWERRVKKRVLREVGYAEATEVPV